MMSDVECGLMFGNLIWVYRPALIERFNCSLLLTKCSVITSRAFQPYNAATPLPLAGFDFNQIRPRLPARGRRVSRQPDRRGLICPAVGPAEDTLACGQRTRKTLCKRVFRSVRGISDYPLHIGGRS
jgi:hypothetical protein